MKNSILERFRHEFPHDSEVIQRSIQCDIGAIVLLI